MVKEDDSRHAAIMPTLRWVLSYNILYATDFSLFLLMSQHESFNSASSLSLTQIYSMIKVSLA
jgi:hypothetical protein